LCRECGARARFSRNDARKDSYDFSSRRRSASSGSTGDEKYFNDRVRSDENHGDDKYFGSATNRRETHKEGNVDESGKRQKRRERRDKNRWPPPFESDGASYIFDARSGLFYEASSDFFYDPKSKLYYGNKEGTYFQYSSGAEPHFRAVNQQPEAAQNSQSDTKTATPSQANILNSVSDKSDDTGNANSDVFASNHTVCVLGNSGTVITNSKKNKIAISLKKKPTITESSVMNNSAHDATMASGLEIKMIDSAQSKILAGAVRTKSSTVLNSQNQKKHEANMEKWSERGKEIRGVTIATDAAAPVLEQQAESPLMAKQTETQSCVQVTKTKCGQPICLLCKRKFASVEKLRQHEKVSALHKQNLAKKVAADAEAAKKEESQEPGSMEYRDRAKERRFLYGPDPTVSLQANDANGDVQRTGPNLTEVRMVNATEVVKPGENLGDSNIGNQLLQKLGWKAGSSLGRKQQGEGSASNEEGQQPLTSGSTDHLRQDWERIESMAGGINSHQLRAKERGVGSRFG